MKHYMESYRGEYCFRHFNFVKQDGKTYRSFREDEKTKLQDVKVTEKDQMGATKEVVYRQCPSCFMRFLN